MESSEKRMSKPAKVAVIAILLSTLLTIVKFILAFLTGSLALKAEAYHSFSDIWSSIMVYVSIRYGKEHDDGKSHGFIKGLWYHPQRMAALYIGIFLLIVSISIFYNVFRAPSWDVRYPVPVALVVLVLAMGSWLLSRFEMVVGEKTGSPALVADAYHTRVDMAGLILVAVALFAESLGVKLDRIAAGILSLFIFIQAISVFSSIIRDYQKKDLEGSSLVPTWVESFYKTIYPIWRESFYVRLSRMMKIDSADSRRNALVNMRIFISILGIAVLFWLSSCFFTVAVHEQAIVERFGRPLQTHSALEPGLHFKAPFPVDLAQKVDTRRVKRMVIGSEISAEQDMLLWTNLHYVREFNVLTGENIFADVGIVLFYKISNLFDYLYKSNRPDKLLEETCYSVMLESIAQRELLYVTTEGRGQWAKELFDEINNRMASVSVGIELVDLAIKDMHPPTIVASEYEDVVSAEIDKETKINAGRGYSTDLIPRSQGAAIMAESKAKADKQRAIDIATGEASRFSANYQGYLESREIFRIRALIEKMEMSLEDVEKFIVPPEAVEEDVEYWMMQR